MLKKPRRDRPHAFMLKLFAADTGNCASYTIAFADQSQMFLWKQHLTASCQICHDDDEAAAMEAATIRANESVLTLVQLVIVAAQGLSRMIFMYSFFVVASSGRVAKIGSAAAYSEFLAEAQQMGGSPLQEVAGEQSTTS
eukprot:SAG11_NODE_12_length_27025_cov_37.402681_2_plen_140_part_00